MKKQSKNTTVIRINLKDGNYTTISRAILENPNLKDSSKTLLQLSLNNVASWELRTTKYTKLLGWCNDKMAGAIANLIENGYMTRKKQPKGQGKGFYYTYVISEYGNLNPNKEQASKEEILNDITTEEPEPQPETSMPETTNPKLDEELWDKLAVTLEEIVLKKPLDQTFIPKVVEYYRTEFLSGNLNKSNFNETEIKKLLERRLHKSNKEVLAQIEAWIDLHNNTGTIDQKKNIKAKALIRFKEQLENGEKVDESEVRKRLLYLVSSIVTANRQIDQRYND